ncbi:uncharacterized protein LOC113360405 [Papaver somniferum]|uniref:uncharacterized protein LOC113360405 n=1 Tax=Papaver somniferum TaxID=3469 RepID=UPI000E70166B|nr:uncharacterized protein LOC113360405 [Papaver somniferum]
MNGCCSDKKWRHLLNLVRKYKIDCICLLETMVDEDTVKKFIHHFPYDSWNIIPAVGKLGGLAFGYFGKSSIEVLGCSLNMVHILCDITPVIKNCVVSFIYGSTNLAGMKNQWNFLSEMCDNNKNPWMLVGDFNFILHASEKQGGNPEKSLPPNFIKDNLNKMNMHEVLSFGNPFTWCNRRFRNPTDLIFEKLDRAFMNDRWVSILSQTRITNLGRIYSDHCPILVKCFHFEKHYNIPYRFFRCWQLNPEFKDVLHASWSFSVKGSPSYIIDRKLSNVSRDLTKWNINSFGHIKTTISKLNAELEKLQALPYSPQIGGFILNFANQLDYWYEIEHSFYEQKSRIHYFTQYDRNTHYFHNYVKLSNMYNTIHTIRDDQGNWLENRDQIYDLLTKHFKNFFTSSCPSMVDIEDSLKHVSPIISDKVNATLTAVPSPKEILDIVVALAPWSSPGPDGFPVGLYKDNWDTVKDEVIAHVQSFFTNRYLLKHSNYTFITLIPKIKNASFPHDFRPISLSNSVYKIISKILTNRLKPILDGLISPFQSAFIANRQIHDNIIITHEILHAFKKKKKNAKNGHIAIKLDLSKAFDRLEWSFIVAVRFF